MESNERIGTNEILAELLRRKDGKPAPKSEGAAILALLLANRALSIMQPEGGNVDFDMAIPVRPPVA
jgi:hypothetical protein